MIDWISVNDDLPDKPGYYLCAIQNTPIAKVREFKCDKVSGKLVFVSNGAQVLNITHWMELPKLPDDI